MKRDLNWLLRNENQNSASQECEVSEDDYIKFETNLKLLQRLSEVENSTFSVLDLKTGNYLLKSPRFTSLLGYSGHEDPESDDLALFHSIIHPDDLPFVLDTEYEAFFFYKNLPVSEKKDYKLVYDFRVKSIKGVYMRIMHQFVILEQDRSGKSWLALIVTDILSEEATDYKPQRRMLNIRTGKLYFFHEDKKSTSGKLLTKRESEVMGLIAQGLDSNNISDRLFISVNTVNNHRQNILSKTRSGNTTQALLYAKKLGIV
jgi:DNA-binding CsgD family transcriptional regulator